MKITERELVRKADVVFRTTAMAQEGGECDRASLEAGYRAAARALGYEIVDEPELPERLCIGEERARPGYGRERELVAETGERVAWVWCSQVFPGVLTELVSRYNAKKKVLETMRDLEAALSERLQGASDRVKMYGNLAATKVAIHNVRVAYGEKS